MPGNPEMLRGWRKSLSDSAVKFREKTEGQVVVLVRTDTVVVRAAGDRTAAIGISL
jgi:hypothetical protein